METYTKNSGLKSYAHSETFTRNVDDFTLTPPFFARDVGTIPTTVHLVVQPSTIGYKNPQWWYQVAHLQNACTTFSGIDYSDDPRPFVTLTLDGTYVRQSDNKTVHYLYTADYQGKTSITPPVYSSDAPSDVVTDVTNRCIRDFLRSVDSAQSSFEAGQDLGEWKQTLDSVLHPLGSLKTGILNYFPALMKRRRKVKDPKALRRILADTYLEFHFGWQPLVSDVAQAIADIGRFRFPAVPVRGRAHSTYLASVSTIQGGYSGPITHSHTYKETSTFECRYKGMLRPRNLGSDGRLSLAQSLQLTPDKWLPTAWDLLPYSWMSDYFVNIGDIISGLSAAMSIDLAWGVKTTRHRIERTYQDVTMPDPFSQFPGYTLAFHTAAAHGGACMTWARKVERQPLNAIDLVPTLQFSVPKSRYPFFNMGAILLQKASVLTPFFRF